MSESLLPTGDASDTKRYRPLLELGLGGMGEVRLASVRGPSGFVKVVVLKMLRPELLRDEEQRQMFLQEARICARLSHPNIAQVYEVTELEGRPTIVMEYLEGQTLRTVLTEHGDGMPLSLKLEPIEQVLSGLHAAHELKDYDGRPLSLIHRDISPHNVFLLYDGRVKLLDFGIAKARDGEVQTDAGILKGKLRYMAPEQFMAEETDRRADLFSVGVLLWEGLMGRRYWGERTDKEVMQALLIGDLPPVDESAPQALVDVCRRALALDRTQRFATAEEFRGALREVRTSLRLTASAPDLESYLKEHYDNRRRKTEELIRRRIQLKSERPSAHSQTPGAIADHPPSTPRGNRGGGRAMPSWAILLLVAALAPLLVLLSWRWLWGEDRQAAASSASAVAACPAGQKMCAGACVSMDRPEFGCASATCEPCDVGHATARCNRAQQCDVALCHPHYDDCDGDRSNGCETALRLDPGHCGACGRVCPPLSHAERGCGDECTIWRCEPGYRDCNGVVADGCEQPVLRESENCGHCGRVCSRGKSCQEGVCAP